MSKFGKKLKQGIALLLAVLMAVTCIPVDGIVVQAAGTEDVQQAEPTQTDETVEDTKEDPSAPMDGVEDPEDEEPAVSPQDGKTETPEGEKDLPEAGEENAPETTEPEDEEQTEEPALTEEPEITDEETIVDGTTAEVEEYAEDTPATPAKLTLVGDLDLVNITIPAKSEGSEPTVINGGVVPSNFIEGGEVTLKVVLKDENKDKYNLALAPSEPESGVTKGTVKEDSEGNTWTVTLAKNGENPVDTTVTITAKPLVTFNFDGAKADTAVIVSGTAKVTKNNKPVGEDEGTTISTDKATELPGRGDLSFTLSVSKDQEENYSIVYVFLHKAGQTGADTALSAESDGTYKVSEADVAGATIYVRTSPKVTFEATDTVDDKSTEVFGNYVRVITSEDTEANLINDKTDIAAIVEDKYQYGFKLSAKPNYEVGKVTYKVGDQDAKELTADDNGVYLIDSKALTGPVTISIVTCPVIKFDLSGATTAKGDVIVTPGDAKEGGKEFSLKENGGLAISAGDAEAVGDDGFQFKLYENQELADAGHSYDYEVKIAGTETPLEAVNGVYTITKEIKAGASVQITARERFTALVSPGDYAAESIPFKVELTKVNGVAPDGEKELALYNADGTKPEDGATVIHSGDKLEFKVTLEDNNDGKRIQKVIIANGSNENIITGSTYTYTVPSCAGDIEVGVEIAESKSSLVVQNNPDVTVELYEPVAVKAEGSETTTKLQKVEGFTQTQTAALKKGTTYVIGITPKEADTEITAVKANGVSLTTSSDTPETSSENTKYYKIEASGENQVVVIETDIAQNAQKTIKLTGDHYKAYINKKGFTASADGITATVKGSSVEVTIIADTNYEISAVKIGDAAQEINSSGVYTVTFGAEEKTKTVEVTTRTIKKIQITQALADVTYTITDGVDDSKTEQINDTTTVYTVDPAKTKVTMEVTVPEKASASVTGWTSKGKKEGSANVYLFELDTSDAQGWTAGQAKEYTITTNYFKYNVTVNLVGDIKEIIPRIDNPQEIDGWQNNQELSSAGTKTKTWQIPWGRTLYLDTVGEDYCGIVSAGDSNQATITVNINDDALDDKTDNKKITINVEGEGTYGLVAPSYTLDGKANTLTPLNEDENAYMVDSGVSYTLMARKGAPDKGIALSEKYVLTAKDAKGKDTTVESVKPEIKDGDLTVAFSVTPGDAGKTLSLTLYRKVEKDPNAPADEAEPAPKEVGTYTLYVRPSAVENISIEGIKLKDVKDDSKILLYKQGEVRQIVDTVKEYKITMKDARSSVSMLKVEALDKDGNAFTETNRLLQAEIDNNGNLKIQTVPPAADTAHGTNDNAGTIKITNRNTGAVVALISVKVAAPAFEGKAPSVTLKSATDQKLNLTLSTPVKNLDTPAQGGLYYKLVVKATSSPAPTGSITSATYYVKKDAAAVSQDALITVNNATIASGTSITSIEGCAYSVEVSMVQLRSINGVTISIGKALTDQEVTAIEGADGKNVLLSENGKKALAASTKRSSYPTKLTFKKVASKIYSGQSEVVAANLQFDKNASFVLDAKVNRILDKSGNEIANNIYDGLFTATVKNGQLILSNIKQHAAGTYTIEVQTKVPNDQTDAPITGSYKVTIVQGIYHLSLTAASKLYKDPKKAAAMTVTPVYNYNSKSYSANTKKVTWEIYKEAQDNGSNKPYTFVPLQKTDALYGMVTVKNGKVTVDKNYQVSSKTEDNTFVVVAKAADYEGNWEYIKDSYNRIAYAEVEITGEKQEIKTIKLMKKDENGNYSIPVTTSDNKQAYNVLSSELNNYRLVAFGDYDTPIDASELSWKSSNTKAATIAIDPTSGNKVKLGYSGATAWTPGKTTISATVTDGGSKQKKTLALNITYVTASDFGAEFINLEDNDRVLNRTNTEYEIDRKGVMNINYSGPTANRFVLNVKEFTDGKWQEISGRANITVSISGATKIEENKAKANYYVFTPTKEKVTIKLTNKMTKTTKTYTLTNTAFKGFAAAPAVKADRKNLTALSDRAQTITYTLTMPKKASDKVVIEGCDTVLVTVDQKALTATKTMYAYQRLGEALGIYDSKWDRYNVRIPLRRSADGTTTFNLSFDERVQIPVGSYKLSFTYGQVNADGTFNAMSKSAAVTLKAAKANNSFKPTASYNLSAKDTSSVPLTYKAGKDGIESVSYTLYNKMYDETGESEQGKFTVGNANTFRDYFELDNDNCVLKMRATKTDNKTSNIDEFYLDSTKEAPIKADQLKGYLVCYVTYNNGDTATITSEIKVNLKKEIQKYAISSVNIPKEIAADTTFKIPVSANKLRAAVEYAYTDETASGFKGSAAEGDVLLSLTGTLDLNKSKKVDLYMVPSTSLYTGRVKTPAEGETEEGNIQKYGIKTKATIAKKDIAAESLSAKAKVAKMSVDNRAFSFTSYDKANREYYTLIPYTMLAPVDFPEINVKDTAKYGDLEFADNAQTYKGEKGYIRISIDADKYKAFAETGIKPGKTATVETTATFETGGTETLKFKLSVPKQDILNTISTATSYQDVLKLIREIKENPSVIEPVYVTDSDELKKKNVAALRAYIEKNIGDNADVELTYQEGEADCPSGGNDGYVIVSVTAKDPAKASDPGTTINIKITLDRAAAYYKTSISGFNTETAPIEVTNSTTEADILKAAREYLEIPESSDLKVTISGFQKKLATDADSGEITGSLVVSDKNIKTGKVDGKFTLTIEQLATVNKVWDALYNDEEGTLKGFTPNNETTEDTLLEFMNAEAGKLNPDVKISIAENAHTGKIFKLTKANGAAEGKGSLTVAFLIENPNSQAKNGESFTTGTVTLEIAALKSISDLKTAVETAISGLNNKIADFVLDNNGEPKSEEVLREDILKEIQTAVGGNPYEAAFIVDNESSEAFAYTPVSYDQDGELRFTVELKNLKGGDSIRSNDFELSTTIDAISDLQKASDITAEVIETELKEVKVEEVEQTDSERPVSEYVADAMLAAAKKAIKSDEEEAQINIKYKAKFANDADTVGNGRVYSYKAPSLNEDGSFTATFVVTRKVADKTVEKTEVSCAITIDSFTQTLLEAVDAVEAAVGDYVLLQDDIESDAQKAEALKKLAEEAQKAVKSGYTVTQKGTVTWPEKKVESFEENGKFSITFRVSLIDEDGWREDKVASCEAIIAFKAQDLAAAEAAVKKAVEDAANGKSVPENTTALVKVVQNAVRQDLYLIESAEGESKITITQASNEGNGSIKGTLLIKDAKGEKDQEKTLKEVEIDVIIPKTGTTP